MKPTLEEEDQRRLHREQDRLLKERGAHSAWIKSLLMAHGLWLEIGSDFLAQIASAENGAGYVLGMDLKAELRWEYERYCLVHDQIKALEAAQRVQEQDGQAMEQIAQLLQLKGVGQLAGHSQPTAVGRMCRFDADPLCQRR
ncbi:MAG: hypothetical protein GY927_08605 [bacterium]|nr:hypothetical protein [bacterium]